MIAAMALAVGFGLIWHIWWLAIVGLVAAIVLVIIRTTNDDIEYVVTAKELEQLDAVRHQKGVVV